MKREFHFFATAILFYTRIPLPFRIEHGEENLNRATKYFPVIGWIVGIISAGTFIFAHYLLPPVPAVVLAIVASVLTTGAFHEDGFADVCDGFGGGWTKEKILEIMKDSRIGTYGATGLVLILSFKISLLYELLFMAGFNLVFTLAFFVTSHSISRFVASTFIFTHQYVREREGSKSKAVANSLRRDDFVIGAIFACIPLIALVALLDNMLFFAAIVPVFLVRFWLGRYFKKWIGGYTGDCLGATQQVAEVVFLLSMLVIWKFT